MSVPVDLPLAEREEGGTVRESASALSDGQLSPGFNIETSTTDSGVSNASSLASSDSAVPIGCQNGPLGSSTVAMATRQLPQLCVSGSLELRGSLTPEMGEEEGGGGGGGGGGGEAVESGDETSSVGDKEVLSDTLSLEVASLELHDCLLSNGLAPSPSPSDLNSLDFSEQMSTGSTGSRSEDTESAVLQSRQSGEEGRERKRWSAAGPASPQKFSFKSLFRRESEQLSSSFLSANSTTGLICEDRPGNLPAKSVSELKKHRKMHQELVAAARKRELKRAKMELEREKQRRVKDRAVADSQKEWSRILPHWPSQHRTKKVRELWWQGLPPGVRGEVWKKAIGNDLSLSPELYEISLARCNERLASKESRKRSNSSASQKGSNREHSVEDIHLDVLRTFPTLGFFQEGGPYNSSLHDVLGAYACYRPDVGYVQGMSFLAAVLLLNMEAADAFICLANLLNHPSYLAFFKVDYQLMRPYFDTFHVLLQEILPKLSAHFKQLEFSSEYYLIEWIITIYTRALPLDIACRVWDMFCRDGDSFLFRTALGILRLFQDKLLEFLTIEECGHFLGKLPSKELHSDLLFSEIAAISLSSKHFSQVLRRNLSPHN